MYLNENEVGDTENLELLNKIAGKYKPGDSYGAIKSHMLGNDSDEDKSGSVSRGEEQ